MADQLEDLLVAIAWLSHAGQGGGGQALRPLLLHQLVFPLFGLGELSGDDHQAQVDHEEGTNLIRCGTAKLEVRPAMDVELLG